MKKMISAAIIAASLTLAGCGFGTTGTGTSATNTTAQTTEALGGLLGTILGNILIEQKLGTYLEKMGFKAGKSVLTLAGDGNCSLTLGSKTLNGTYAYDANTNKMTMTGMFVTGQLPCTVTVQNGQLLMLFDADKLLSIASAVGSKSSSSIGSILQSYSGLKLGWAMNR